MTNSVSTPPADATLVDGVLGRVARELGMMLGRELVVDAARVGRARSRPAGTGSIHVSFKLGFAAADGTELFGCLLVPLADAITMAAFLLMMGEDAVAARREEASLDAALKNALLEIGNMIASAAGSVLTELGLARWSVRSVGCQGVRDGVRPAFPYVEGSELVVGRTAARFEPFPCSQLILILPLLG